MFALVTCSSKRLSSLLFSSTLESNTFLLLSTASRCLIYCCSILSICFDTSSYLAHSISKSLDIRLYSNRTSVSIVLNTCKFNIPSINFRLSIFFLAINGVVLFTVIITQLWNTSAVLLIKSEIYVVVFDMLSRVISLSSLNRKHLVGLSFLTIEYALSTPVSSTVNFRDTSLPIWVTLFTICSFFSSRIVSPNNAKCMASAIVDFPTPFRRSGLSIFSPVITFIPGRKLIITGSSPTDRKFWIFNSLNVTNFIYIYCISIVSDLLYYPYHQYLAY